MPHLKSSTRQVERNLLRSKTIIVLARTVKRNSIRNRNLNIQRNEFASLIRTGIGLDCAWESRFWRLERFWNQ